MPRSLPRTSGSGVRLPDALIIPLNDFKAVASGDLLAIPLLVLDRGVLATLINGGAADVACCPLTICLVPHGDPFSARGQFVPRHCEKPVLYAVAASGGRVTDLEGRPTTGEMTVAAPLAIHGPLLDLLRSAGADRV